jgi:hypothetical protein
MKTYFVHNKDKDIDYIVIPQKTVLVATSKIFSDFLYSSDLSKKKTELKPGPPEAFGEIVAVLENDHLKILNQELWAERRQSLEW